MSNPAELALASMCYKRCPTDRSKWMKPLGFSVLVCCLSDGRLDWRCFFKNASAQGQAAEAGDLLTWTSTNVDVWDKTSKQVAGELMQLEAWHAKTSMGASDPDFTLLSCEESLEFADVIAAESGSVG